MVDAFGGSRIKLKPPERGVFPLDHDGECKEDSKAFLKCLKDNSNDHFPCKNLSKAYLQCRMDKELMAKEDLSSLGLGDHRQYERVETREQDRKENKGFVAGIGVRGSNKCYFFCW